MVTGAPLGHTVLSTVLYIVQSSLLVLEMNYVIFQGQARILTQTLIAKFSAHPGHIASFAIHVIEHVSQSVAQIRSK